ncbi:MAG TPA: HEAT repeat domain-containing protein, partial [Clostridia bacterium]|nr:HEAT repeat domain-containing protein [Clostridia bacterium]
MRPKIAKALAEIEHGSELEACEASKQLAGLDGQDVLAGLFRILRTSERFCSREAAAYALSWNKSRKAVTALLMCASNAAEQDLVRGQAVEGLAIHLASDSVRSQLRRKAEDLMIEMLQFPSPMLRFWACYGLGRLGCQRAIPRLLKLKREDRDVCPGWWYVWEEAEDAIEWIAGR